MSVYIIIPARYASTRFPGKPLAQLRSPDGISKSLIQRSWEAASAVSGVERVIVATDDDKIAEASSAFGAEVCMTSEDCANGTERCADALKRLGETPEIVVNFQGDAPLTPPWFVEEIVDGLKNAPDADAATPVLRCDGEALTGFLEDRREGRVGATTAVFGTDRTALYFSKEVIPYINRSFDPSEWTPVYHHVGVYAYRPSALTDYGTLPAGPLEQLEGLEQLRFMEHGRRVLCVEVDGRGQKFWELNNPEDIPRIEAMLVALESSKA